MTAITVSAAATTGHVLARTTLDRPGGCLGVKLTLFDTVWFILSLSILTMRTRRRVFLEAVSRSNHLPVRLALELDRENGHIVLEHVCSLEMNDFTDNRIQSIVQR